MTKKRLLIIGGGLVGLAVLGVVALIAITLLRDDDPNLLTTAPAIPTPTPGIDAAPTASIPIASGNVLRFVVDPAQSSATYVVRENSPACRSRRTPPVRRRTRPKAT